MLVTKDLQLYCGRFRRIQFSLVPYTECKTRVFRISGVQLLVLLDLCEPMRRWRALAVVAEVVCSPEGIQSMHTKLSLKTKWGKPNHGDYCWGIISKSRQRTELNGYRGCSFRLHRF